MSKNRFIRLVALAGCSVLFGAFGYTPGASAHIGASHAPYTTTVPDLLTATITASGQVRACFDETVTINSVTNMAVEGYDSALESQANAGSVDPADSKCVLLDMDHPALSQATIFTAQDDAVNDTGGAGNFDSAVTLQGSTFNARETAPRKGNTAAPELLSVNKLPGPNRLEYTLDEPLDADTCDATSFGYHEGNGDMHFGATCFDVSGAVATIQFNPADDIDGAVRYFAEPNAANCANTGPAIRDRGSAAVGGPNTESAWTAVNGLGDPTADPDLTNVSKVGNNILAFTFDELVQSVSEDCFWAFSDDGDGWEGDSFTQPSGTVVNVAFQDVGQAFDQIVRAGVEEGAVLDSTNSDGNSWGSFDLETGLARSSEAVPHIGAGYTSGWDMEQAVTDKTNDTVKYCGDEPANTDLGDYDTGNFFVYDNAGTSTSANNIVSVQDNCFTFAFSGGDVDLAVAAGSDNNAHGPYDRLKFPDDCNFACDGNDSSNEPGRPAAVKVDGPAPTGTAPPATPPTPPAPTPPGQPEVRTGLCDPARATAPLAELLIGGNGPDLICGFGGDDTLRGLAGADTLKGQQGDDTHSGSGGKDNARGGPGNDTLRGGKGSDTLKGGGGRDTARGGKGNDLCRAENERGCES